MGYDENEAGAQAYEEVYYGNGADTCRSAHILHSPTQDRDSSPSPSAGLMRSVLDGEMWAGGGVGDVSELTRCPGLGGNLSTIPRYTACRIRSCDTQTIPTCIVSILMTPGFYSFQAFAASRAYADHERKVRSRPTPPPPPPPNSPKT